MRRFVIACILALPFAASALTPIQESAQKAVREGEIADTATPIFGKTAEHEFNVAGHNVLVACGSVNVKNAAGKMSGERYYFAIYDKDVAIDEPFTVVLAKPSEVTTAMNQADVADPTDPRAVIMNGYANCIIKLLNQR